MGRVLRIVAASAVILIALVTGCQSRLIYFPRPYAPSDSTHWQWKTGGRFIDYPTSQGRQRAFLQGNLKDPRNLWIVCGGNGSLALDWANWIAEHGPKEDAWLLVDFPGYGESEGTPSPSRIRENLKTAIPLASKELGWPASPDPKRLRFFGHSLGCAACLLAASDFHIQRGVLIAPFTSTMEMSRAVTGLPLGFLVWHRFDNAARLDELDARGGGEVFILHGVKDEVIPVAMSRGLAADHPRSVRLREIPEGFHNTIPSDHAADVSRALHAVGSPPSAAP